MEGSPHWPGTIRSASETIEKSFRVERHDSCRTISTSPGSLIGEYDLTVRDSDTDGSPEQARDNEARRDDGEHELSDTESEGAFRGHPPALFL